MSADSRHDSQRRACYDTKVFVFIKSLGYYRSRDVHTPMLQEVFDGYKEGVLDMIAIMESLGVHARKVMWTNLSPPSPVDPTEYPPCAEVTCGPVWDYDWD